MATAKLGQIQSIGEPLEHNSPLTGGKKELDELFRGPLHSDPAHEWLWGASGRAMFLAVGIAFWRPR